MSQTLSLPSHVSTLTFIQYAFYQIFFYFQVDNFSTMKMTPLIKVSMDR